MNNNTILKGHIIALFTIFIWGTTFIATKFLLVDFTPIQILFYRFFLGYIILFVISPGFMKYKNIKEELIFAAAGATGVTFYFLCENTALNYTTASNVGVLVSISPFLTAIFSKMFLKNEDLNKNFFLGFFISMIGIVIINFNGNFVLKLNPLGDILAILATISWSIYSVLMKKLSNTNKDNIKCTRKVFFYGIIIMLPILKFLNFELDLEKFSNPYVIANYAFLTILGSSLCYVTWNISISILGAIKTSAYIYMLPVITVISSAIFLKEKVTSLAVFGIFLIISGLFVSDSKKDFLKIKVKN